MNKFKKSQVLVLFVLVVLLVITPFLPSSLRPTYLYFIINFIIMTLCAEAGLLSFFAKPLEDKKQPSVTIKPVMPSKATSEKREQGSNSNPTIVSADSEHVDNAASDRVGTVTKVEKEQNCPSTPSLFFISVGEADEEVVDEEIEAEEEIEGVNGQELFTKAEAFIGNFYNQLKMQSEESWIYQKAL